MNTYIKITYGNSFICTLSEAVDFLKNLYDEGGVGEVYSIEVVQMSKDDFENLDEFKGF